MSTYNLPDGWLTVNWALLISWFACGLIALTIYLIANRKNDIPGKNLFAIIVFSVGPLSLAFFACVLVEAAIEAEEEK